MVGVGSGAARILDLLLPRGDLEEIAGKFAACAPEIHLKREGILAEAVLGDPLQRRVRDQTAVPIIFAFDLGWGKSGRQRTACHNVLGADGVRCSIEIYEITGAHIDRPDAQSGFAGIDALKIDEALKRALQQLRVVEACRLQGALGVEPRRGLAQREKSGSASKHGPVCAHLVEQPAREISLQPQVAEGAGPVEQRICRDLFPEAAELRHTLGWMVTGDNGGVDSADGNAGDPIRVKVRFGERFIDPGLIGAQRATPLQQQSEALEGRPVGNSVRFAAPAKSSFSLGGSVHSPPPLIRSRSKMQPTSLSVLLITVTVGATSPRR